MGQPELSKDDFPTIVAPNWLVVDPYDQRKMEYPRTRRVRFQKENQIDLKRFGSFVVFFIIYWRFHMDDSSFSCDLPKISDKIRMNIRTVTWRPFSPRDDFVLNQTIYLRNDSYFWFEHVLDRNGTPTATVWSTEFRFADPLTVIPIVVPGQTEEG